MYICLICFPKTESKVEELKRAKNRLKEKREEERERERADFVTDVPYL